MSKREEPMLFSGVNSLLTGSSILALTGMKNDDFGLKQTQA
jgi:hypothetical protein